MEFLRGNRNPVIFYSTLLVVVYGFFIFYDISNTVDASALWHHIQADLALLFCLLIAPLIFINNFYIRRNVFFKNPENSVIDVLDDRNYTLILKNNDSPLAFVVFQMEGYISGFPVTMNVTTGRGGALEINFSFIKTTGIYKGHERINTLYLKYDMRGRLRKNVQEEVAAFLQKMKGDKDQAPDDTTTSHEDNQHT